jgi:hypothetical protein
VEPLLEAAAQAAVRLCLTDEVLFMREKAIEQKLVKAVRDSGGLALKLVCPGFNGVPDRLLLFMGGKVAFVEVKAPGEKPRPLQVHRMEQLRRMGFPVYVINGVEQIAEIISDAKSLPLEGKVAACGRMRCNSSSERSSK